MRRSPGEGRIFRPTYRDRKGERRMSLRWCIRYRIAGKEYTESTGSRDRRVAVRLLNERLHAIRAGKPTGPHVDRTMFGEFAEMIRTDYDVNGRKSGRRMKASLAHLEERFNGWHVSAIGENEIAEYVAQRLGEGAQNGTINRELACLKRMLRLGQRAQKVGRIPHIAMLEERTRRRGFFEPDQFRAVCEQLPADLRALAVTAYITGWRIASELTTLQWSSVDFVNGFLRLEDSKNREGRMFAFTPDLKAVLQRQRERTSALEIATQRIIHWVFWRVRGPRVPEDGKPVRSFRKAWTTACRKAGLEGKIPHDFRRTAVRNLELAGVPRSVAMAMVGHKTESIYRRYAIVDAAMMRLGAERLASLHEEQSSRIDTFIINKRKDRGIVRRNDACKLVAWDGIEPPTRGFSVLCSAN
jgi:integrase